VGRSPSNPGARPCATSIGVELYYTVLNAMRLFILLVGSLVIFVGIIKAALEAGEVGVRERVARHVGTNVALGLEFFIGATILNLILNPTWVAVATTLLTIAVRTLISMSLGRQA
jgi:uncharacterized membrane protein